MCMQFWRAWPLLNRRRRIATVALERRKSEMVKFHAAMGQQVDELRARVADIQAKAHGHEARQRAHSR